MESLTKVKVVLQLDNQDAGGLHAAVVFILINGFPRICIWYVSLCEFSFGQLFNHKDKSLLTKIFMCVFEDRLTIIKRDRVTLTMIPTSTFHMTARANVKNIRVRSVHADILSRENR